MDNASGLDFTEILAQAQEQMAEIAAVQRKLVAMTSTAAAADGLVKVSVNAQGVVIETTIDTDYLDDHDINDLGAHVTQAAQAAAQNVQARATTLMGPVTERRKAFPSLSEIVEGAPDIRQFAAEIPKPSLAPPNAPERLNLEGNPDDHSQADEEPWFGVRA